MSDTDAHRILVPVGDSDTLRDTVSYAVEQASAAAPNRPVELHFVVAAQTQSVNPDAPEELGSAREQLERVPLWIEEDTGTESDGSDAADGLSDRVTVVTEIVGTDRYLFSPGDFADALLEYAAEAGIDQIVVDPGYNPAGTASMLRPMSVELGRGDVPVETAPDDRPTQSAALARAASLSKYLSVFVVSYLFYMSLSAWKPLDFLTGFVTASIVSAVLAPVVANRSAPLGLTLRRLARLVVYAPYLVKEIAVANLQVAYVVLHPDMPIDPEVVQLRAAVWGDGAVTTLANSITLTPGTLTVNVSERSFDIHSLTADSREDLFDGGLERAVRFVFYGRAAARIPTPRERGDDGEGRDG
ncbi:monovalent cation/H+ antiporter subunit E [Halorubrum ejinorense]|uniref:Monovalent cation/H+ antiporter subunit E n=1 Tax=Halorubrum ejinorense TaxID=425309 RepID=A0AAV3SWB8_9EURY